MKRLMVWGTGFLLLIAAGCANPKTPGMTTTTLPSSTGTVVTSPSTGAPVVVTSPAPVAMTSAAPSAIATGGVHHVVTGQVTDVDRNSGKVNILASDGSKVQVILPPLAAATANKGDRASIDITIGPMR